MGFSIGCIPLEDILEIDREPAIDYEITFAAFLATAILSTPNVSPPLYPIAVLSAFILLFITLVRRIAFLNPYSKDVLGRTTPLLVLSTAFGIFYIVLVFGSLTQTLIPIIEPRASTLALAYLAVFCLISVLLYEVIFRDFFLLIAAFAYNNHLDHQGTLLGRFALALSQKALDTTLLPQEDWPDEIHRIPNTEQTSPSEVPFQERILNVIGTLLGALGVLLIFAIAFLGIYLLLSSVTSPSIISVIVDGALLGIAVNYLIVALRFLYGRYGQTPYVEIAAPKHYTYYSLVLYGLYFLHVSYEFGLIAR